MLRVELWPESGSGPRTRERGKTPAREDASATPADPESRGAEQRAEAPREDGRPGTRAPASRSTIKIPPPRGRSKHSRLSQRGVPLGPAHHGQPDWQGPGLRREARQPHARPRRETSRERKLSHLGLQTY